MDGDLALRGFKSRLGDTLICTDGEIEEIGRDLAVPHGHEVIDLDGAVLLPGFVDAHAHLQMWGVHRLAADLSGARSWEDALALVDVEEGFFLGVDYDDSSWPSPARPRELDRFDVPVVMRRVCGHRALGNDAAVAILEKASAEAVEDGTISEKGALGVHGIFEPPMSARIEAVRDAADAFARLGITTVHEISPSVRALEKADVPIRWRAYRTMEGTDLPRLEGFDGIKLFSDGSIGSRTAWMTEPYEDGGTGAAYMPQDDLEEAVANAAAAGVQMMVHALGDAAAGAVANAFEKAAGSYELRRPRIEHLELVPGRTWEVLDRVGGVASMQPNFVASWGMPGGMYESALGERYLGMNRFRTASGRHLAFGSDCMPPGPLFGIGGAIGHPNANERLTLDEAVAAYTAGGAYAGFMEDRVGSLEPGKACDGVAVRGGVPGGQVIMTVVGGNVVFDGLRRRERP